MNKRLNITLPEQTVRLMDRVAGKVQRSRLIDRAVRRYIAEFGDETIMQVKTLIAFRVAAPAVAPKGKRGRR